ncbi:TetR/AcrR family transcriptional regulator [Actinomadura atramentaria]|uniref:TetR/AcrR family transcriptional regulator n=1 Tax=Actinomadura atramentaria TaxID=1990 RepID=UPI00036476B9|nr:TetR/AcrR family transcriptional regulator [Actinomadura atramentaria]
MDVRRERRERTRAALLTAARRLWAERGIHGASLDDIAAAAGLTKGAVYSNFTGKTDLVLALMERCTADQAGPLAGGPQPARAADGTADDDRVPAMLLVEFWLYGMRDYAAGWRVADWWAERRERLAEGLATEAGGHGDGDDAAATRAALALALDIGVSFQHLLDPDRVPANLYAEGLRLMLGDTTP